MTESDQQNEIETVGRRPSPVGHRLETAKRTGPHLVIEYAFACVIAAMMLAMGAAFFIKFLRWALW